MPSLVALPYAALHTHERAGNAWAVDATGALALVGANLPRVDHDMGTLAARGLLIEGARTNGVRNPRAEGVTTTTYAPGLPPVATDVGGATSWRFATRGSGLSVDVAPVSFAGRTGMRVRWYGTVSAAPTADALDFELRNTFGVAVGTPISGSVDCRLVAGSIPVGVNFATRLLTFSSGGTLIDNSTTVVPAPVASLQPRVRENFTPTAGVGVGGWGTFSVQFSSWPASTAVDFTIDVFNPQIETGALATSRILPPVGAPGPSTRDADRITRTLNHRFSRAGFTMLARGLFAQAAPAGMTRGVLQLDDGTNANRIRVENIAGGSALQLVTTIGGTDVATLPLGNMTPGTPFAVAFAAQDGDLAAVRNGGAVQAASVAVPPGIAFMRVGASGFDHANPMNGWYRAHRLLRGRADNASLLSLVA